MPRSVLGTVRVPEISNTLFCGGVLCCTRSQHLWPRDRVQSITSFCMDLLEHSHNHLFTYCLRWLSCYQSWVIKQRLYHPQSWHIYCLALYSKVCWLPGHTVERDSDHTFTPQFLLLLSNTSPRSALPYLIIFSFSLWMAQISSFFRLLHCSCLFLVCYFTSSLLPIFFFLKIILFIYFWL